MTEFDLGAAVSTRSGAGARTAWAVVLQRIGRRGSAARHNVKNGAGYGRECEEDEEAEGDAGSGTYGRQCCLGGIRITPNTHNGRRVRRGKELGEFRR